MKKKKYLIGFLLILVISFFWWDTFPNESTNKVVSYNGDNLRISIDGVEGTSIPTSDEYYLVDYSCKSADTVVTWDREKADLKISNGKKKAGVSCYLDFQSTPKLADMDSGSYVSYVGNNGCSGNSCSGQNANYVSDTEMGYCFKGENKYLVSGWRLAYSKNGNPYLISAGATDCMCTDSSGSYSSSNTNCSSSETMSGVPSHLKNLNTFALKYCNVEYAYNGVCDNSTSWAVNLTDFENITGKRLSSTSCYDKVSDKSCGYGNDLIDIGGHYWYANSYTTSSSKVFYWKPSSRDVYSEESLYALGVRPVLKLDSSVVVVSGSGTYEDPYQIMNRTFQVSEGTNYVNASQKSAVSMTLVGTDVATMCISVDSSACSNYVTFNNTHTLDWSSEEDGEKIVYVYYKNSVGTIVSSISKKIILDSIAPENSKVTIGDGDGLTRNLGISSTGADSMCFSNTSSLVDDCTDWVRYSTSYRHRLTSGIGSKTVYAFFKDKAGNVSSTTATTTVSEVSEYIALEYFDDATYDSNLTISGSWTATNGRFQSSVIGNASTPGSTITSSSTIVFKPTMDAIMSFDYGVSSEPGIDKLTIILVGSDSTSSYLVNGASGIKTGSKTGIQLISGVTYTMTVTYVKDGSAAKNEDLAYIDNLIISS